MLPTKKHIAILHPYVNKKGGAVQMMLYISGLLTEKNKVIFHTFDYDKSIGFDLPRLLEVKKYFLGPMGKVLSFFLIAYHIRKCDYIIIGNSPMQFVAVFSKILFFSKAKLIWWHHHYPWYYIENTSLIIFCKRSLEKFFTKYIDCFIANSIFLQKTLKEKYNRDSQILYPVLGEGFGNQINTQIQNNFTLLSYGRWVEGKNIGLLFSVYESLKDKIPSLKLIVGGTGEELEIYKNKYKGNKNISFIGLMDQKTILSQLEKANVFLFPSKIDSFGLVLLESMSQGVPVICFEKPGQDEIIQNEIDGFLVKTDSEFIEKTKALLMDDSLRQCFSQRAVKKASTFNVKAFEKNLSIIWKSL